MSVTVRKAHRGLVELLVARINALSNMVLGYATIANGTTAGKLKTTSTVGFKVDGVIYTKSATDDLWDLSAETDTLAGKYRAYWLYIDASGTATFAAITTDQTTAALALAALPEPSATKAVFGVYVAGPSTDFNAVGGLSAQGTIYHGIPAGACTLGASPNSQAGLASRLALIAS